MPGEFLKNPDNSPKLDNNGEKVKNPEYKKYTEKWGVPTKDEKGHLINLSLPKEVILDENDNIQFKGEK